MESGLVVYVSRSSVNFKQHNFPIKAVLEIEGQPNQFAFHLTRKPD